MVKDKKGYAKEQYWLIVMIPQKGKYNDILKYLYSEKNSEVVIVLHNLGNKFNLLDISTNKTAKTSIQSSQSWWFSTQLAIQLKRCTDPADVTILSKLSDLKPLHPSCILDFYNHMFEQPQMTIIGFHAAGITEAVNEARIFLDSVRNPFKDA